MHPASTPQKNTSPPSQSMRHTKNTSASPSPQRAYLPFSRNQGPWEPIVNHIHDTLTHALTQTLHRFWEQPVTLQFIGVGAHLTQELLQHEGTYWVDFPHEPESADPLMLSVQLSEDVSLWLLENTLGESPSTSSTLPAKPDNLDDITNFEITLLNAFCQQWVDVTLQSFGPLHDEHRLKHQPPIDFVWALYHNTSHSNTPNQSSETLGKVALQIPADILRNWLKNQPRPTAPHPNEVTLPESLYDHAQLLSVITLGSSRVHLNDLKELDVGDVMVLEDSDIDLMTIKDPRSQQSFEVDVQYPDWVEQQCTIHMPPYMQPTLSPNEQEHALMTNSPPTHPDMQDAFWNQLLIDVRAEFLPIRIPLNELKQLSDGLIMEVGDLANNTIRLHIDDKTIARGELVIVGDKFGVRIKSIEEESDDDDDDEDEEYINQNNPNQPLISVVDDDDDEDEDEDDEDTEEGMPINTQPAPIAPSVGDNSAPEQGGMPMEMDSEPAQSEAAPEGNDDDDELFDDEDDW